jgi:hypothetical protein
MKECKVCGTSKESWMFYNTDSTCKECRKAKVRANRASKVEYYRNYDKERFQNDPKVKARHAKYAKTEAGKKAFNEAKKKWAKKNAIKKGASTIVGNAVRDGRLKKPNVCEYCKNPATRIHGHHDDYAFPLVVRWLCPKCHSDWHKENGEGKNAK